MSHKTIVCSCGKQLSTCRCPAPNKPQVVSDKPCTHKTGPKPRPPVVTTNPHWHAGESDADHARRRGWVAGTRLIGDEGAGPEVIKITALGRDHVLAFSERRGGHEGLWTLRYRDWQPVES